MSRVITNTFWLMLAQFGGLLIPLLELPVLARALGQQSYGQVLYALGLALTISVFVEFGFNFSAARKVVKIRENKQELAQLVTNVLFAKLLLSFIVTCIISALLYFGASTTEIPHHWFIWISFFTFALGFTPLWYYVGIEKLVLPIMLDLCLRSIGLVFIITLVSSPHHAQRVLVIQSIISMINTLLPTLLMIRSTGFGVFSLQGTINTLKEGWELFLYKGTQSIMGSVSSPLLGWLNGTLAIGTFVPAEKLVRAAIGLATPMLNAAFPHIVKLQSHSANTTKRMVSITIIILFIVSIIFVMLTTYLASWVVNTIFGSEYQDAIMLLKILVYIVPLRICSMTLAILWFIPRGKEVIASRTMMLNIIITLLIAIIFVPTFGALGMCISLLAAEFTMFFLLLLLYFVPSLK
ncbi:oligosaccharide flippase family protein [Providencia rettgeri]